MIKSRTNIYLLTCITGARLLNGQFNPVEPTGLPYHIIISEALIDSIPISEGSIIGIFDDTLCVGADTIQFYGQENIDIVTWEGSIIAGDTLMGFDSGNPIQLKVFCLVNQTELLLEPELNFEIGSGYFGSGSYSVVSFNAFSGFYSDLELETNSIYSNPTQIGYSDTLYLEIQNSGNISLQIDSITIDSDVFVVESFPTFIDAEEEGAVTINFAPSDTGTTTSELFIYSNDYYEPVTSLSINGIGLIPSIVILQDLPDFNLFEDSPIDTFALDLESFYTDYYSELSYNILNNYHESLFVDLIEDEKIIIEPYQNWNGFANIELEIANSQETVIDSIYIEILPVNDSPEPFSLTTIDTIFLINGENNLVDFSWESSFDVDGDSIYYSFKSDLIKIENNQHYVIYSYLENTLFNHFQIDSQELLDIIGDSSTSESILRWNVFAIDGFDSTISSNGFDTVNIKISYELNMRGFIDT